MKSIRFTLFILLYFINNNCVNAQTMARIKGDICAGGTLSGFLSTGVLINEIKWFKDTTLLVARSAWQRNGVVVAGGNGSGSAPNQFYDPKGLFVDKKNNLYIVTAQSVKKWAAGATTGTLVAGGNGKGRALNQFYSPSDVVVDDNGNIYVSDYLTNSVRKWAPGATAGTIIAGGTEGSGADQFSGPQSICMDRFGNIYVSDRWNHRVQKWAPGAKKGVTVAGGNGKGAAANQLYEPSGVGVDYAGNVYVSDAYNYRVQKWKPGAKTGVTVAGGNGNGKTAKQLSGPGELSVDSAGNVYVIDGGYRVQLWVKGLSYGITVAGGYGYPASNQELDKMWVTSGLFVTPDRSVYISDLFDARVRKFKAGRNQTSDLTSTEPGTYRTEIISEKNFLYKSEPYTVISIPLAPAHIKAPKEVNKQTTFTITAGKIDEGATCTWAVPADVTILSGQGTNSIKVKWGAQSAIVKVVASNKCGFSKARKLTILVKPDAPVSASTAPKKAVIDVYPNPAWDRATVGFTAEKQAKYEITVTNLAGRQILQQQGNTQLGQNKVDVNLSNLTRDIYMVSLRYDDNISQVLKLSKQ